MILILRISPIFFLKNYRTLAITIEFNEIEVAAGWRGRALDARSSWRRVRGVERGRWGFGRDRTRLFISNKKREPFVLILDRFHATIELKFSKPVGKGTLAGKERRKK